MIIIDNKPALASDLTGIYPEGSIGRTIVDILSASEKRYAYRSLDELKFEISLRGAIVDAARQLQKSNMAFEVFRESRANPEYWIRRDEGGFLLKAGVEPSEAVDDIFKNGSKYGTECATAMQIVYLKALLDVFPEDAFNRMFKSIYLLNWHSINRYLRQSGVMNPQGDYLPGDRRYFANPDVDPETPEWQGENVIDLGGDLYYGHGIGTHKAETFIRELNQNRKSNATREAYLVQKAGRPDFKRLYDLYADTVQNSLASRQSA
jgi:protein-glutamine gamma-glutamyltransferase